MIILLFLGLNSIVCAESNSVKTTHPQGFKKVSRISWSSNLPTELAPAFERERLVLLNKPIDSEQISRSEAALTKEVRSHGFLIGQAIVSTKNRELFWESGYLEFTVLLGNIGQIEIKNTSSVNTDWIDALATHALCPDGLGESCVLTSTNLERMTQLVFDVAGLQMGALEFSANGVPIGQTKIIITTIANGKELNSSLVTSNQGFSASGRYQLGGATSLTNLLGIGDIVGLSGSVSNQGSFSGGINASGPLSSNGLRWQSALIRSQYSVPTVSSVGLGDSFNMGVAYPIVRGLSSNWTAGLSALEALTSAQTLGVVTSNKTIQSGQILLDGNSGDRSVALGPNSWYVHSTFSAGQVNDSAVLPSSTQPYGSYKKATLHLADKFVLDDMHNVYATFSISGQVANSNLDPFEKLAVGGSSGMRAYSPAQASFNQGTLSTVDLRQVINSEWGQFSPVFFIDYANGWINHATSANWQINQGYSNSNLPNHMALSDAGLGLEWADLHGFVLSITWATRLPITPANLNTANSGNSQVWLLAKSLF